MTNQSLLARTGVLAALLFVGCQKPSNRPEPVRPVRAVKVGDVKAVEGRQFPGRARAKDEVDISFRIGGPLVSLPVDVGSMVAAGDVIAAIDPRDFRAALDSAEGTLSVARANLAAMQSARPEEVEQLRAAVAEAEATYRQAFAEHERNAKLLSSATISRSDFDMSLARRDRTAAQLRAAQEALNIGLKGARPEDIQAKQSEIRALEAAVENARNQLEYTELKAPFAGRVAARYVDNFQTVQPKQPIVRLLDISKIEVTIQVPESLVSLVPQVTKAICRFDAIPGREFEGRITKVGSEASQTTRTYPVTIELDQPEDVEILPGMAATIRGHATEGDAAGSGALVVPPDALFAEEAGQKSYLWVVDQGTGTVSRRAVTLGALTPVGTTVTEGLAAGEWVLTAGVHSVREGQQVRLLGEGRP